MQSWGPRLLAVALQVAKHFHMLGSTDAHHMCKIGVCFYYSIHIPT